MTDTPTYRNPDTYATEATKQSIAGFKYDAFNLTVYHHRAKADWVLVNGNWVPREGVMRPD